MLDRSRARICEMLPDDAVVLDVGGWAVPFPRADWVIDLAPYETRGTWGYDGDPREERFTAATWIERDICDREPWPFADASIDFAICSHTLEDVRDPIWVCSELVRIARAGYIEVPSREWEQSWGAQGAWVGWGHHHWLVDVDAERGHLDFVFKPHLVHADGFHFPAGFVDTLSEEELKTPFWWERSFSFAERIFYEAAELEEYLRAPIEARSWEPPRPGRRPWRRSAG